MAPNPRETSSDTPTIIWAVEPFSSEADVLKSAAWCLRALVRSNPSTVQPVYVWPTSAVEFPISPEPGFEEILEKQGQDGLASALSRVKVPGIRPLKVIAKTSHSVREEARELVNYANEVGAKMIVVSTHGRKGLKRILLGSFAETLSLYSTVPLLTVHPNWRRIPEFKKILFPTDFSDESKLAFREILSFAEKQKSRVILFHKVGSAIYPAFDFGYVDYGLYDEAFKAGQAENKWSANELVEEGKKRGVRVDVVFDRSRGSSVSGAILKQSKRLGCMVGMAAQSGSVSSVLLGSTVRQVIRHSEQPVWIVHCNLNQASHDSRVQPLFAATQEDVECDLIEHGEGRTA